MNTIGQLRQGDVLLVPVDQAPPNGLPALHEVILAVGELTGHAHRAIAPELYEWRAEDKRYIRVGGQPGSLSHEDHDPIPVAVLAPNMTYQVIQQQELDLKDVWQTVRD